MLFIFTCNWPSNIALIVLDENSLYNLINQNYRVGQLRGRSCTRSGRGYRSDDSEHHVATGTPHRSTSRSKKQFTRKEYAEVNVTSSYAIPLVSCIYESLLIIIQFVYKRCIN